MNEKSVASTNPTQRGVTAISFVADTTAGDLSNDPAPDKRRFSFVEVLAVIAIIAVLVAILSSPVEEPSRGEASRTACRNNLKKIGLALFMYRDAFAKFPPAHTVDAAGIPLHSWRTLILPFLDDPDERKRYESIDLSKPWDDPANAGVDQAAPSVFRCPRIKDLDKNQTTYLAIMDSGDWNLPPHLKCDARDDYPQSRSIIVIEVTNRHAVHWMSPIDFDKKGVPAMLKEENRLHIGASCAITSAGESRYIRGTIDPGTLKELLSEDGTYKEF